MGLNSERQSAGAKMKLRGERTVGGRRGQDRVRGLAAVADAGERAATPLGRRRQLRGERTVYRSVEGKKGMQGKETVGVLPLRYDESAYDESAYAR